MKTAKHEKIGNRFFPSGSGWRRAACTVMATALACSLASCNKHDPSGPGDKGDAKGDKRAVPVTATTAVAKPVPLEIKTFGSVVPSSTVSIKALVTEIIRTVHFKKGQKVRKGDLLFMIDPRTFQAALTQAEANLARDKAQAENSRKEFEREDALLKKGVASQTDYDKSKADAEAQAAIVNADQAAVDNAKIQLEHCTIRSPIDGRAGDIYVNEGNLVTANETALVVINQISPVEVHFFVAQDELALVRKCAAESKLAVEATDPKEGGKPETGELFFIDNAIDKTTGTVMLGAAFANPGERLWPGQYVNVRLILAVQDLLVVPSRAVQTGRTGKYVFVVRPDSTVEMRPVKVGAADGEQSVIREGLHRGEQVVTDGQLQLLPGSKVQVKPEVGKGSSATKPATGPASQ